MGVLHGSYVTYISPSIVSTDSLIKSTYVPKCKEEVNLVYKNVNKIYVNVCSCLALSGHKGGNLHFTYVHLCTYGLCTSFGIGLDKLIQCTYSPMNPW